MSDEAKILYLDEEGKFKMADFLTRIAPPLLQPSYQKLRSVLTGVIDDSTVRCYLLDTGVHWSPFYHEGTKKARSSQRESIDFLRVLVSLRQALGSGAVRV